MATKVVEWCSEEEVAEKVPGLRTKFLEKYAESIDSGKYDKRDVERIKTDDAYVKCFIRSHGGNKDPEKATDMIDEVLTFRKEYNINDITEDTFPAEVTEINCIYWKGLDIEGAKMLHFKVCKYKKHPEMKRYICHFLEKQQRANPGERIVLFFDFQGAGVTSVDLDAVKFIIACMSAHFPCSLSYILNYEMSWLLSSVWKIIKAWLTEEQKKIIHQIKKSELQKYIDAEQIVLHFS